MKKYYTFTRIRNAKTKILNMLGENEGSGVALTEILEKTREEKELVLTALDDLLNYNACVVLKDDKYYFEA